MKQAVLPVVLAVALIILVLVLNKNVEAPGIILAGALGLGIGAILNNVLFKRRKKARKEE